MGIRASVSENLFYVGDVCDEEFKLIQETFFGDKMSKHIIMMSHIWHGFKPGEKHDPTFIVVYAALNRILELGCSKEEPNIDKSVNYEEMADILRDEFDDWKRREAARNDESI